MADNAIPFNTSQTWPQRVLIADDIWQQVKEILETHGETLPKTPRRPDTRLILNNVSDKTISFLNPGDHSNETPEEIPAQGEKTAVMVMLQGDTLEKQLQNARTLVETYNLQATGFTPEFAALLGTDATTGLVKEAYGPAPHQGQSEKLVDVTWTAKDGSSIKIAPVASDVCSYGVRAPENETIFSNKMMIFVQGSDTTPELIEGAGICIAVSSDWQTGIESTRPIAPSVAQEFYGEHFNSIPRVKVDPDGNVQSINLSNGKVFEVAPPKPEDSENVASQHYTITNG